MIRFFAALEAGDVETLREIYAPDAVIWHNDDLVEQPVEDNLKVLRGLHRAVSDDDSVARCCGAGRHPARRDRICHDSPDPDPAMPVTLDRPGFPAVAHVPEHPLVAAGGAEVPVH